MLENRGVEVNTTDSNGGNKNSALFTDVLDDNMRLNSGNGQSEIKKCYIFMNCFAISLGFMQFGIGMASFSNSQNAF